MTDEIERAERVYRQFGPRHDMRKIGTFLDGHGRRWVGRTNGCVGLVLVSDEPVDGADEKLGRNLASALVDVSSLMPQPVTTAMRAWLAREAPVDTWTPVPCDSCSGTGRRPCSTCSGDGEHECDCGDIHDCHDCDGFGSEKCWCANATHYEPKSTNVRAFGCEWNGSAMLAAIEWVGDGATIRMLPPAPFGTANGMVIAAANAWALLMPRTDREAAMPEMPQEVLDAR